MILVGAALLSRPEPSTAQAADDPAAPTPAKAAPSSKDKETALAAEQQALNIKYAETFLQLSQVSLQKAMDFNRRVPGGFSEAEVDRLRRIVAFAEERLQWVKSAGHKQADANIFMAEVSLRSAEQNYQKAMNANTRVPGAVSPLEIERLRLTLELARMSMEKARLAAETNSPVDDVQWELDQLREDVMQLRSRVDAITARR
jgi:hypothetical protein